MANPWFRVYSELATDPKIQRMSEADQRRFLMILCLRCSNGDVTLHDDDVTFQLRISNEEWNVTKALFLSKNLIDENNNPVSWDKRQFQSDSSQERVKRHRQKRAANGLPQQNYIPKTTRQEVFKRDENACVYCGSVDDLTIDHNIPQSRGGDDQIDNLITACRACNAAKRDLTHDEYIERNVTKPLLKQHQNRTDTEQIQNRTEQSKPKAIRAPRFDAQAHLSKIGIPDDLASDWIKNRKAKKAEVTKTVIDGIAIEAVKAGISLDDALRECCVRGWAGFKADWLLRDQTANARASPQQSLEARNKAVAANWVPPEMRVQA